MSKINSIADLRNDLLDVYEQTKSGEIDIEKAKELANVSGKVIKTLSTQIKYQELTGNKHKIDFLEPRG